jgi:hypothetical protein
MDERLRFVARLLEGDKMAAVCREFGISRVTGYKIFNRYKECGLDALNDRSRRPYRHANKLPFQVERTILAIKREHGSWGAPKIRDKLIRQLPMLKPPATSTIHAVLDRHGLVKRRKRRRYKAQGTELIAAHAPNGLWCADFKGEFMLGNKKYCYPLTITDYRSRYLLACEALASVRSETAFSVFERAARTSACRRRSEPIMARPSPRVRHSSGSRLLPSGGCGSVSRSSASNLAIHSKMAGTSACTEPSRRKPRGPPPLTSFSSKSASTDSSRFTTMSARTRAWLGRIPEMCIHLPRGSTSRRPSPSTRITIERVA